MVKETDLLSGEEIYDYFSDKNINYERLDHPPVYTAEESERLVPRARGAHAKNLLVEERKTGCLFMLTVPFGVRVDLAATAAALNTGKLRFASADIMQAALGVTPGAVSMLALLNDRDGRVTLVLDQSLWEAEAVQCHPLVNTTTLIMDHDNLARFLSGISHQPKVLSVPFA